MLGLCQDTVEEHDYLYYCVTSTQTLLKSASLSCCAFASHSDMFYIYMHELKNSHLLPFKINFYNQNAKGQHTQEVEQIF